MIQKRELHQNWEFRQSDKQEWMPAHVPGCVHTDLMAAGIIEDPFYRSNEDSVQWISKKDWVYRTTFTLSAEELRIPGIDLVFEGLDTHASVTINGIEILKASNMFRTWEVPVKNILKAGQNTIEIYFRSPEDYNLEKAAELSYVLPEDERVHSRKAPYHFGWDWGPRLITSGIWRPVYLQFWNETRIENLFIYAQSVSTQKAVYNAQIEIKAINAGKARIDLSSPDKKFNTRKKNIDLKEGLNTFTLDFEIDHPELWWPNGMGNPSLYNINIELTTNKGTQNQTARFGVRTIELVQTPDEHGSSFEFHVNGIPVFAKGANYIPLESFLTRLTENDYKKAIDDAVKANYNMLRVWGGGIYEDQLFYNLCDENGIMVWQDFMFACAMYPGDEPFLENVRHEVTENVRRLRNHTSIALWCGNNEIHNGWFDWGWQKALGYSPLDSIEVWSHYQKIFHQIIPNVLAQHDTTRQYWPSSPSYGWGHKESTTMGDNHYWGVWWGKEPFEMYRKKVSRFMSEFGFQSFPSWETIHKFTKPEDRNLWSSVMRTHQKHPTGNQTINEYLKRWYPEPKDFESYVYVSQILQAEGMMIGIAAHRQAMPYSMGTLYWQFNDCWPVASWSSRDYYGNWKAMHYYMRKAYANLFLSPVEESAEFKLYLVSDLPETSKGELILTLFNFDGTVIKTSKHSVEIKPNSQLVYQKSIDQILDGHSPGHCVLKAELTQNGNIVADNHHFFEQPRKLNLKPVNMIRSVIKSDKGYKVTLSVDYLARHVYLNIENTHGWWSDNFFDLIPGNSKTVFFETSEDINDFENKLKVTSLIDAF